MSYGNRFLMRLESQEMESFKLLIDSFCQKDIFLKKKINLDFSAGSILHAEGKGREVEY